MSTTLPETRARKPAPRSVPLPAVWDRHPLRLVVVVAALGALLYVAPISGSSLFIDEVFSWRVARGDVIPTWDAIRLWEVTPPLYYLLLHAYIDLTGSQSEVALRLPSAIAAVGLVFATWWLALALAGRRAAAIAAGLTAFSPLVFDYAQQVRAYVFVLLAVTIAAAAAVEWTRRPGRRLWPAISVLAAAVAILLHYTAALVLVPIVVWTLMQRGLPRRDRAVYLIACALPGLALVPLLLFQAAQEHQSETAEYARVTVANLFAIVGTPFDGRATGGGLGRQLGALAVVEAIALLAFAERFRTTAGRGMLLGAAVAPVGAVLALSIVAQPAALTRYTAVAAPFMLVAIAIVVGRLPRLLALLVGSAAVLGCVIGLAASLVTSGHHPDVRAAVAYAGDQWERGDRIFSLGYLGYEGALDYYAQRDLPGQKGPVLGFTSMGAALNSEAGRDGLASGERLWFVTDPALSDRDLERLLAPVGYEPLEHREFAGRAPVQVVAAGPRT
jgi:hypothetical protein